jgi:dual specificity phosphatase 3
VDFNFVHSRLATGGAVSTLQDVNELADAGITHVLSCRSFAPEQEFIKHSRIIDWLHNPTEDDLVAKPVTWFLKGITFALGALAFAGTKVYVHCNMGRNRGPSMAYAILRAQGLFPEVAEKLIRDARPCVTLAYLHDADRAVKLLNY